MTRIIADISVPLDGFVTGPDPGPGSGLGTGGEALHTWAFAPRARRVGRRNATVHRRSVAHTGPAERDLDNDRDRPDLRRLPVIR
ncbi:hypothetical protein GCM10009574_047470 [Streptomyces asiaticus]|uniref:Uncharacterized protein n=2 Tax=Streptomyces rhizosphaericus TaxID=114699 RepID=A0ABN1PC04_9ACTN